MRSTLHPMLVANARDMLLRQLPKASKVDVFAVFDDRDQPKADLVHTAWPEIEAHNVLFLKTPAYNALPKYNWGQRFYEQWSKVEACLGLVLVQERLVGQRYDFFLRARSDLYYFHPAKAWLNLDDRASHSVQAVMGNDCTPSDHFGAMPRYLASAYASAGEIVYDSSQAAQNIPKGTLCHCPNGLDAGAWPECLISAWLIMRNVSAYILCPFAVPWTHTRVTNDNVLTDDQWKPIANRSSVPSLDECSGITKER
jgi:hypothetical protein